MATAPLFPNMRADYLSVALAAASIWSMGGIIFGIASLYPVLYYERALEGSACGVPIGLTDDGMACNVHRRERCCDAQELQFTSLTSMALFAADGAMLVYGELGDRFGPRACFGTGYCLAVLGLLLLASAASSSIDYLWYMAFLCIGVSGPGVFMGCLFLGERYPQLRAVISAVGAAMWDGSALVFQLFAATYFSTVPSGSPLSVTDPAGLPAVGLSGIATAWAVWCLVIGLATFRMLPSRALLEHLRQTEGQSAEPLSAAQEDALTSPKSTTGCLSSQDGLGTAASSVGAADGGSRASAPASFLSYFCRSDTRLLLAFMGVFNLKSSFYIATFATQMSGMFFPPTASMLATTFNIAFPVGGFCTSAIASVLLDRLGEREDLYMTLVLLLAIMFGIYNLLPYAASQFASALLFGPTRTLQWACYFHFLSLPKRYPPQYVGRLLGYGNLVVALVGDVPLSFLNWFVLYTEELGSSSARYLLVHFGLQLALIACLALPWHLHKTMHTHAGASLRATGNGGVPYADQDDEPLPSPSRRMNDDEEEEEEEQQQQQQHGGGSGIHRTNSSNGIEMTARSTASPLGSRSGGSAPVATPPKLAAPPKGDDLPLHPSKSSGSVAGYDMD